MDEKAILNLYEVITSDDGEGISLDGFVPFQNTKHDSFHMYKTLVLDTRVTEDYKYTTKYTLYAGVVKDKEYNTKIKWLAVEIIYNWYNKRCLRYEQEQHCTLLVGEPVQNLVTEELIEYCNNLIEKRY